MGKITASRQITEGVIWKQILIFFFPILLGTFFSADVQHGGYHHRGPLCQHQGPDGGGVCQGDWLRKRIPEEAV